MNPRKLRLGFLLAAAGMLSALVLPLSSEHAAGLMARPVLLVLVLGVALLFAIAAWVGGIGTIVADFAGVLAGATATLALLRDPGIAGSAAAGFWAMVVAVWLAAALGVMLLAGSYYGQTVQIWSALLAAAILASGLIGLVGLVERGVARQMGTRP